MRWAHRNCIEPASCWRPMRRPRTEACTRGRSQKKAAAKAGRYKRPNRTPAASPACPKPLDWSGPVTEVWSLGNGTPRDSLRDTWTVIQTIRVECWAMLQLDGNAPVTAFASDDRVRPTMIHGIVAHVERLSAEDEEWAKVLMAFPGGEIACRDGERCRLSLQDGRTPPERSLDFDLIAATREESFIIVTQMVYGRSGFVYGVRWREAGGCCPTEWCSWR